MWGHAKWIAPHTRNIAKLNISSHVEVHNLIKFFQYAKLFGNGLAVIDFTSRAGQFRNEYKVGGDWERALFIESMSFGGSTGIGSIAGGWYDFILRKIGL